MAGHPSSRTKPFRLSTNLKRDIRSWSRLWGLPSLSQKLTVRFNGRLRTTVARLLSGIDVIEVGPRFISLRSKRREILCHELAHAAVNRRLRGRQPPHGAEWAALVQRAGFDPVAQLTAARRPSTSTRPRNVRYEHRCLVCQFIKLARRPVHSWRCPECVRCGLPGDLKVSALRRGRRSSE
jgi:predicted SprT family Zn-dependent metalloprotease